MGIMEIKKKLTAKVIGRLIALFILPMGIILVICYLLYLAAFDK